MKRALRRFLAGAVGLACVAVSVPSGADGQDESDRRAATIVARAREEVARRVSYDPSYVALAYPGGDVDPSRGVCTDVVIRSLRTAGVDLQTAVHEDATKHPKAYALGHAPDGNIDHRRVGPLLTWFRRHAVAATTSTEPSAYAAWKPGDVVVWAFHACPSCSPNHIGVVSDRKTAEGRPLVLHNLGPTATEDDDLAAWTILGHFHIPATT